MGTLLIGVLIGALIFFPLGFFVGGRNAKKAEALRKQTEELAAKTKERFSK